MKCLFSILLIVSSTVYATGKDMVIAAIARTMQEAESQTRSFSGLDCCTLCLNVPQDIAQDIRLHAEAVIMIPYDNEPSPRLALDSALELMPAKYVVYLPPAAYVHPDYVKNARTKLEADSTLDGVYGDYYRTDGPVYDYTGATVHERIKTDDFAPHFLVAPSMAGPFVVWRARLFERYGSFAQSFRYHYIWEFLNRAVSFGAQFAKIGGIAGLHCTDDGSNEDESTVLESQVESQYSQLWDVPFVIIAVTHNNVHTYQKMVRSLLEQSPYPRWRALIIDDGSQDGTAEGIAGLLAEHHDSRITFTHHKEIVGYEKRYAEAIGECVKHEVVMMLKGDEFLESDTVFEHLNTIYTDCDVWLTYGSGGLKGKKNRARKIPDEVYERYAFRLYPNLPEVSTFYAGLFKHIEPRDRVQYHGKLWSRAVSVCLYELAGQHAHFDDTILFRYTKAYPRHDLSAAERMQENYMRRSRRFRPVQSPFAEFSCGFVESYSGRALAFFESDT